MRGLAEKRRLHDGAGAEDHLRHAEREQLVRSLQGADATAHLHRHVAGRPHHAGHQRRVHRLTRERPIQIHHMQPSRAGIHPAPRHGGRVVAVNGCRVLDALAQLHTAPALDVDGRNDDHGAAFLAGTASKGDTPAFPMGHGDQRAPFVEGRAPARRGSCASAARNARPNALNTVSA